MDPENIITQIGGFGRYQKIQYALFAVLWVGSGIQTYLSVFLLYTPPFRCAVPDLSNDSYSSQPAGINESIPFEKDQRGHLVYSHCQVFKLDNSSVYVGNGSQHEKVSCRRWVYDQSQRKTSAVTEMNFVCDRKPLISVMNMLYMVGVFLGSFLFGTLSDKKGRKVTLYVCIVLYLSSALPLYVVNEPISLGFLRIVTGSAVNGIFMSTFILTMEMVSCSQRSPVGLQAENFFALGEIVVVAFAYGIRDWHLHAFCATVISLPCLTYWFLIKESPRWLISKGRLEEAKEIFIQMAKMNKRPLPNLEIIEKTVEEKENPVKNVGIKEIFKSKILLIRSLIVFFNWAVINMVYYGLMFNAGSLSSNLYESTLLSALVEIPAYTTLIFTMDRWGRKPLFCGSIIFSGLSCIASAFVNIWAKDIKWLSLTLALSGKFAISASFAIVYNMTAELFPTVVRNAAIGVSSSAGRIGSMVAPYITLAGTLLPTEFGNAVPLFLFGAFALAGGLLSLMLPETLGRILPETIEDGENFGRKPRIVSNEVYDNKAMNITKMELNDVKIA